MPVYAAIAPWSEKESSYYFSLLFSVGQAYGFELKTPWQELSRTQQEAVLFGTVEPILIEADSRYRKSKGYERRFEGVLAILERQLRDAGGESARQKLEKYQELVPCSTCAGQRLRPEALAVRIGPYNITDLTAISVGECLERIDALMGGGSDGQPLCHPARSRSLIWCCGRSVCACVS